MAEMTILTKETMMLRFICNTGVKMSYTINFSKQMSGILHPNPNMLKSTKEKMERQSERDSKVAFFEAQKENLKNMKTETVEDIAKKLEMFHTYEDEIAAAKQEYNSSQMFHIMDEAEEEAEKRAKEAEKNKPKTEEERKEEAVDEALGTDDDKGMLAENMEKLSEITDQMTRKTSKHCQRRKHQKKLQRKNYQDRNYQRRNCQPRKNYSRMP